MSKIKQKDSLRIIENLGVRRPSLNLALEEAISRFVSEGFSPPTVRFWRDPESVIIGRSQEANSEVDFSFCEAHCIPVYRRPSGGGTVIHHPKNLNYSIYLPQPMTSEVEGSSLTWNQLTGRLLSDHDLPVKTKKNGLFVDGLKISGSAQSRRWGLLHHGTLLIKPHELMEDMDSVLKASRTDYESQTEGVLSRPSRVSDVESLLKKEVIYRKVIDTLVSAFSYRTDLSPRSGSIKEKELLYAGRLEKTKYGEIKADRRSQLKSSASTQGWG